MLQLPRTKFPDDIVASFKLPRPEGDDSSNGGCTPSRLSSLSRHLPPRAQLPTGTSREDPIEVHGDSPDDAAGSSGASALDSWPSTPTTTSRGSANPTDGSRCSSDVSVSGSDSTDAESQEEDMSDHAMQELREELQRRDETIIFLLAYVATMQQTAQSSSPPSPPELPRGCEPSASADESAQGCEAGPSGDGASLTENSVARYSGPPGSP